MKTLDLDRDVLESVQAIANREQRTLGAVFSELVRRGLIVMPESKASGYRHGFRVLPKRNEVITSEHVRRVLGA
ncbi:MAG: hypothetical protein K9K35_12395 [Rhodoferax sp.]|nr:hypothetical protein [Rhodoferax sp.]MCF8207943.1 hypothetical protein [Rhodoferax sp.]